MAKDIEKIMEEELTPLLGKNESMEYYLYGEIAPTTKKIGIIIALTVLGILGLFYLLPIPFVWQLILIMFIIFIAIQLFYRDVYIGKFGKRVFLCEKDIIGGKKEKEIIPLKFVEYVSDRSDDTHITLLLEFNEEPQFIIIKRKTKNLVKQSLNIEKLVNDILKKHK